MASRSVIRHYRFVRFQRAETRRLPEVDDRLGLDDLGRPRCDASVVFAYVRGRPFGRLPYPPGAEGDREVKMAVWGAPNVARTSRGNTPAGHDRVRRTLRSVLWCHRVVTGNGKGRFLTTCVESTSHRKPISQGISMKPTSEFEPLAPSFRRVWAVSRVMAGACLGPWNATPAVSRAR